MVDGHSSFIMISKALSTRSSVNGIVANYAPCQPRHRSEINQATGCIFKQQVGTQIAVKLLRHYAFKARQRLGSHIIRRLFCDGPQGCFHGLTRRQVFYFQETVMIDRLEPHTFEL